MSSRRSAKNLYAGVDGGGTRTRVFLLDPDDFRCALGESSGCNPVHTNEETVRTQLGEAFARAFAAWHQCYGTRVDASRVASVFVGAAGFVSDTERRRMRRCCSLPELSRAKLEVDMEMRVTLFSGLEAPPGISLVVGTGTACYAEDANGRSWQSGGWENLVSDEGSAYWIGLEGIIAAVRMADGRLKETGLKTIVFNELGIENVEDIITRLHSPPIGKAEVAKLAVAVLREAERGERVAREIALRGSRELAAMVDASRRKLRLRSPKVSVAGGGMQSRYYQDLVFSAIREQIPTARVTVPALSAVLGAVLLALRQDGRQADHSLMQFLKDENARRRL